MKAYLTAVSAFVLAVCLIMNWSSTKTEAQSLNVYAQSSAAEGIEHGQHRELRRGGRRSSYSYSSSSSRSSYSYSGYRGYSGYSAYKPSYSSYASPSYSSSYSTPSTYYKKTYKKTTTYYTSPSSYYSKSYYSSPSRSYYSYSYNSNTYVPIAFVAVYSYGYNYSNDPQPHECKPADTPCIEAYKSRQGSTAGAVFGALIFICCCAGVGIFCCLKGKKGRKSVDGHDEG